ncbi:MAG: HNH endonuclease [Steroidobacteraceae bacterium]
MAQLIHVHHVKPLSAVGRGYQVDPVKDLIPICPNCHAVAHHRDPPYSPEELRDLLRHR